jgi:hypothetical protein
MIRHEEKIEGTTVRGIIRNTWNAATPLLLLCMR